MTTSKTYDDNVVSVLVDDDDNDDNDNDKAG